MSAAQVFTFPEIGYSYNLWNAVAKYYRQKVPKLYLTYPFAKILQGSMGTFAGEGILNLQNSGIGHVVLFGATGICFKCALH